MPRSKPLGAYPNKEYGRMYANVSRTQNDLVLPMERTAAFSLRATLYAWAKVARAAGTEALREGLNPEWFDDVRLQVVDAGLRLYHKNHSVGVPEIRSLLDGMGVPDLSPQPIPEAKVLQPDEIEAIFDPESVMKRLNDLKGQP